MRVFFRCLFTALLTVIYCFASAQTKTGVIQGKVLAENNSVADAATVVLINYPDSSMVNSRLVSKLGLFQFERVKAGTYLIWVTKVGYNKAYSRLLKVAEDQTVVVDNIVLQQSKNQLQTVTVTSRRPLVEIKPGKKILNVKDDILASGSSAYDILRKSSGVHVNSNETLSISGRQPALITINGKATNFTGEDLINLLRGIQSSTIDQIEIITSTSAKYDASGGSGVINIILQKGKNFGTNGSVNIMGGYGKYYKSTAGIVFNNRTAKLNVFGNYTVDNNKSTLSIKTDRTLTDINAAINNTDISNFNVDYNNIQKLRNHNFKLGADYNLTPKQTLGVQVNGIVRVEDFTKNNNLNMFNQGHLDSTINAVSTLDRGSTYINYNLNYNAILDKKGKNISVDGNYATYRRHSNEYITNYFTYLPPTAKDRDTGYLRNLSPSEIQMWTVKMDYVSPISKVSSFEAGLKYNDTKSDNNLIFGPRVAGVYRLSAVSNRFVYTEAVSAGYVNYTNKIGRFDIMAGVRAEYTESDGESSANTISSKVNYFDLFPQVQLGFDLDKKNVLGLSYNRGIIRPAYEEVNPFLYFTDLYDYRAGNPNLKPEYTDFVQLTHTYNQSFSTTLYYKVTKDAFDFPVYNQNDSTKVNTTIHENFGRTTVFGVTFFTPVQFTSWWLGNFSLDANYVRYKAYAAYGPFNRAMQDITLLNTQSFTIGKTITAELMSKYETPTIYGVNTLRANFEADAGISKQVFNKHGSIRLTLIDIFNTDRTRNRALYRNVDLSEINKRDSRVVKLEFTYNFGKNTIKSAKKRDPGNSEEKERIIR